MLKSELRADLCREKASHASWFAGNCGLPQVRDKHELAAGAWLELVPMEDQRSATARRLSAASPAKQIAPLALQATRRADA